MYGKRYNIPANRDFSLERIIKNGGYYDIDGIWNSILEIDGHLYRGRVETLILDGDNVFMQLLDNNGYRIPGGSYEINVDNKLQAEAECKEEARLIVKNTIHTGIHYIHEYEHKFKPEHGKIFWDGTYNEVFIAEYDKQYTGFINDIDKDEELYRYGRFYPLVMVKDRLSEPHKRALEEILWDAENKLNTYAISPEKPEEDFFKESAGADPDNFFSLKPIQEDAIVETKIKPLPYYTVEQMENLRVFSKYGNIYSDDVNVSDLKPFYESYKNGIVPDNYYDMLMEAYADYQKYPCNETKQRILCLGYNPEIMISDSVIEKVNLKRNKPVQMEVIDLTENYIFSKKDDVYNFDKWENGECNILFITGHSGSGKSTLAHKIADEYGAKVISLDHIQCYERFCEANRKTDTTELIRKYLKTHKDIKVGDFNSILIKSFKDIYSKMFPWLIKQLEKDKDTLYVVEGIHIMLFTDYEDIKDYPLICINTSMSKSIFRHWIRDQFTIKELIDYGLADIRIFNNFENQYNDFKDSIK